MARKYVNGQYIFHQPCGLWNAPCVHGCGYIHLSSSTHGSRKKCCANSCLSSASDNFDKELMMDHDLDQLPQFLRQIITLSPEFLKKSSIYNNLVAMAATVVGNYNQTHGFSWCGQWVIRFHERSCPSLYENCIKYLAKLRYLLLHIWWYSITCRLCGYMKCWSCDTVKYLQRSQEWKSLLRWSTFSCSRGVATCRRHQCCPKDGTSSLAFWCMFCCK